MVTRVCRTRASRGVPCLPLLGRFWRLWGPELVVGHRRRCSWRTSGSGCHGGPTLRCRGRGHPARAVTFPRGRGQVTRSGTGLLSPTASNDPARDDTHPAARNVPVGGDGLPDGGAQRLRTYLRAPGLCPQGPCSWPQVRSRRRAGSVARVYGVAGGRWDAPATDPGLGCPHAWNDGGVAATDFGTGCPHEALQDNGEVRP